ncbi:MAG TPA: histidine kinase N-terminal 7TM domain-containing protein, partial [Promineifilum sp.]|nr:histidine kinase N-terminal 7TM domain-containing protein [Promineifilum sp.]
MDIAGWQFTPFFVPVLGAAIFATALALFAWRRRDDTPGTWVFLVLVSLTAWWSFTYALELATTDPGTMLLWVKMEWITIALLPLALLLFALVYTGYSRFVTLRNVALLMILPLINYLRERDLLLLLDNCEHLQEACAQLVAAILETCPAIFVLATSREPLGVPGEQLWPVPTFAVPAVSTGLEVETLLSYDAVHL